MLVQEDPCVRLRLFRAAVKGLKGMWYMCVNNQRNERECSVCQWQVQAEVAMQTNSTEQQQQMLRCSADQQRNAADGFMLELLV